MKRSVIYSIVIFFLGMISCNSNVQEPKVKNIIFMIGDGMGVSQLALTMDRSADTLNMEKAEFSGFCTTHSLNRKITDSAAGGTAMASGKKTKNGMIGMDTTGQVIKSILHYAEEKGLSTGLVSTSAITHATPASFIAHQTSRNMTEAIAADFLKTDIEVFIGGGYNYFAKRKDSLNLVDSLLAKGYTVDTTIESVVSSESGKLAGLLSPEHLPSVIDGRGDMLPVATKKALEVLSKNQKGFFLMVEGSQIDWGGHANDEEFVVSETLDFDKALGVALDFAKNHPGTLIVVSADHETGGLTLPAAKEEQNAVAAQFSTGGHSAVMVPVFSYGTGASHFSGIMDNTDFYPRFLKLLGFDE